MTTLGIEGGSLHTPRETYSRALVVLALLFGVAVLALLALAAFMGLDLIEKSALRLVGVVLGVGVSLLGACLALLESLAVPIKRPELREPVDLTPISLVAPSSLGRRHLRRVK